MFFIFNFLRNSISLIVIVDTIRIILSHNVGLSTKTSCSSVKSIESISTRILPTSLISISLFKMPWVIVYSRLFGNNSTTVLFKKDYHIISKWFSLPALVLLIKNFFNYNRLYLYLVTWQMKLSMGICLVSLHVFF